MACSELWEKCTHKHNTKRARSVDVTRLEVFHTQDRHHCCGHGYLWLVELAGDNQWRVSRPFADTGAPPRTHPFAALGLCQHRWCGAPARRGCFAVECSRRGGACHASTSRVFNISMTSANINEEAHGVSL